MRYIRGSLWLFATLDRGPIRGHHRPALRSAARRPAAAGDGRLAFFYVSKLSSISHNDDKLLRVLEYLLAQGVSIVTANYLPRPHEVWVRRRSLLTPSKR